MTMASNILIIIPAYNEERTISKVIGDIRTSISGVDILVINDGSHDKTEKVVRKMGMRIVNLPFNMGYGAALQTGFKYALRHGYQYAIQMDADGQHEPKNIPKLLQKVLEGEADVVIGSRFLDGGRYKPPLIRKIGMLLFGYMASLIIGQKITDPTSGYQALNSNGIRFYASEYFPTDYPDADVIIMLHRAKLRIREVPVTMYPNSQKSMHGGIELLYYLFKMFLSIFLTLLRKNPFPRT